MEGLSEPTAATFVSETPLLETALVDEEGDGGESVACPDTIGVP